MRRLLVTFAVSALMLAVMPVAAMAGGSADKATGEMTWNRNNTDRAASFVAHEERDNRPAKGTVTQWGDTETDFFTVTLDMVEVYENDGWACFGGEITAVGGTFDNGQWLGHPRLSVAIDGGEPGEGVDFFGGHRDEVLTGENCVSIRDAIRSQNDATSGNVQIHVGKGNQS